MPTRRTDKLITPEELVARLKMAAEGMKKQPGLMKSSVGYMELLQKYVERIAKVLEQRCSNADNSPDDDNSRTG